MADKRRSLLAEIGDAEASIRKPGVVGWWNRMEQEDPESLGLINEAVDDFNAGGRMLTLFNSMARLQEYLSGRHEDVPCDPPVLPEMSGSAFRAYVHLRKRSIREQKTK